MRGRQTSLIAAFFQGRELIIFIVGFFFSLILLLLIMEFVRPIFIGSIEG